MKIPHRKRFSWSKFVFENFGVLLSVRRKFCHAVLDSRDDPGLPPELFDHARSIATLDQNREWRFSRVLGSNFVKKKFFQKVQSLILIYTPKEAHSRIFVTGGSVIAWQIWAKKKHILVSWGGQLPSCNNRNRTKIKIEIAVASSNTNEMPCLNISRSYQIENLNIIHIL